MHAYILSSLQFCTKKVLCNDVVTFKNRLYNGQCTLKKSHVFGEMYNLSSKDASNGPNYVKTLSHTFLFHGKGNTVKNLNRWQKMCIQTNFIYTQCCTYTNDWNTINLCTNSFSILGQALSQEGAKWLGMNLNFGQNTSLNQILAVWMNAQAFTPLAGTFKKNIYRYTLFTVQPASHCWRRIYSNEGLGISLNLVWFYIKPHIAYLIAPRYHLHCDSSTSQH